MQKMDKVKVSDKLSFPLQLDLPAVLAEVRANAFRSNTSAGPEPSYRAFQTPRGATDARVKQARTGAQARPPTLLIRAAHTSRWRRTTRGTAPPRWTATGSPWAPTSWWRC